MWKTNPTQATIFDDFDATNDHLDHLIGFREDLWGGMDFDYVCDVWDQLFGDVWVVAFKSPWHNGSPDGDIEPELLEVIVVVVRHCKETFSASRDQ